MRARLAALNARIVDLHRLCHCGSVDRAKRKRKPAVQNDGVSQSGTPTHTPTPDYADRGSHSFYPGGWSLSLSSVLTGIFWRRRRWWFGGLCRVRAQEEERTAHRCRY